MSKTKLPLRANQLLLPTLFDRLRDDAPQRKTETPEEFTVNKQALRDIIQRDLAFLLNSINKADVLDEDLYPEVMNSSLNYGLPSLSGKFNTSHSWSVIQSRLIHAIRTFEPRILPDSLEVNPIYNGKNKATSYNTLSFSIEGKIYSNPYPLAFVVQSAIDIESNRLNVHSIQVR